MPRGGSRPGSGAKKGSKWPSTLAKEAMREQVRLAINEHLEDIIASLVARAKGTKFLVARDPKSGKFITRLTQKRLEDLRKRGYDVFEVWSREPSDSAARELLDRAIDRPKEQQMEVRVEGDWDKLAARLASARQRVGEGGPKR